MNLIARLSKVLTGFSGILARGIVKIIGVYQVGISPYLGNRCRFVPSCSEYLAEAVILRGPFSGLLLGIRRLCRCHPLGGHGLDPVK